MIGAVVCWSAYAIYSKHRCSHIPPVVLTFYSFLVCTLVLIPVFLMEKPQTFLPQVPASAWLALLFMAVFCSGIAYYIQQAAIRVIGPTRCAVFVNLVPVFSFILATLIDVYKRQFLAWAVTPSSQFRVKAWTPVTS